MDLDNISSDASTGNSISPAMSADASTSVSLANKLSLGSSSDSSATSFYSMAANAGSPEALDSESNLPAMEAIPLATENKLFSPPNTSSKNPARSQPLGKKIFSRLTLAIILPTSFIFLAYIEITEFFFGKIIHNEYALDRTEQDTSRYEINLKKVISVIPKVWKRLVVTFIIVFAYNIVALLVLVSWQLFVDPTPIGLIIFFTLLVAYFMGFVYISIIWHLASVVSVLEDVHGIQAMLKSKVLIKGRVGVAVTIFLLLNLYFTRIQMGFEFYVNKTASSNSRDLKEKKLKPRKALLTWDDSDESDKETSEDDDVAQLCFMAKDDHSDK
ncbi:hypothetical protein RJ640_014578, partial [Escallonia rubra]